MSLSEISIKRPVFAWMLMAALIVFGWIAFKRMGVSQLPDVDFPVVSVSLSLEGAAPEIMEVDVVDPLEDALMGVQGITNLTSSSRMGSASISVEFDLEKNIDTAVQEIQNVISRTLQRLPKDIDPPVVTKSNPEDNPIIWLSVSSATMPRPALMSLVRDQIKDKFSSATGVGEVMMGGYVDPSLRVWLSSEKLKKYYLTVSDIFNTIQLEHTERPSGRIENLEKEINIRTMGEAPTAEEFGKLVISKRGGAPNYNPIRLNQVARIEDGLNDVRSKSRVMGVSAVGLGIKKQRGTNAVAVAKAVKERLEDVKKILPKDVDIAVRFDSTKFIEDSVHELNFTLILSAILTALVCWAFLGSWSATMNVVLAIPTSVVGTFIVLLALGFTLNTFTLLALSLAIGIVVDDAIMVLENIVRHKEMKKDRFLAALDGSREITFAALAATVAIIAIFLPVAFMKGIIGKFFYQFGVTLSVAVALSLLEALTLTPMRCSQYLDLSERSSRIGKFIEAFFEKSALSYEKIVTKTLKHRGKVIGASLLFFVLSYVSLSWLRKEFVPSQDQSRLFMRVRTDIGSSIHVTDAKVAEIEKILSQRSEVAQYFSTIGQGSEVNVANIFITLKDFKDRPRDETQNKKLTQQELMEVLRKEMKLVKGAKISLQDLSLSGFSAKRGYPIEFTVQGPEWAILTDSVTKITQAMDQTKMMTDIDTDYREGMPEVRVVPDREKTRAFGVSIADVSTSIDALMGGQIAGKFSKGGHRYDVRVRLEEIERKNPDDIKRLDVRNNRGELIPISSVVKLEERMSLQGISRQNRQRAITVFANVARGSSQAKAIEEIQRLSKNILPSGYFIQVSGSAKTFQESMSSLVAALVLGILVSYMVLASQFNSFLHPLTVLVALPFSVSGAFLALLIANQSLNIFSMIGLILLMGIVKKNSILLVDFTNQLREEGMGVEAALIKACPVRLRPILMTSIATIAGALPAAFAIGPGAESRIPMAVSVVGGVLVSTVLTLFVVPCVYSLLSKFEGQRVKV
jgi:hydrophobe/amphiphile efflux-1 (HAE1) family protein